jgi:hypothetical protein
MRELESMKRQLPAIAAVLLIGSASADSPPPVASHDALVPGTDYHAITEVPCSLAGAATAQCPAGVKRRSDGSGTITVTWPDGRTRTLYFERGQVTGYERSHPSDGEFSVSRQGDLSIVHIGSERYEIADALPFGG